MAPYSSSKDERLASAERTGKLTPREVITRAEIKTASLRGEMGKHWICRSKSSFVLTMCSPWLRKRSNQHPYERSNLSNRVLQRMSSRNLQNSETETGDLQILVSMGVSLHESGTGSEEAETNGQTNDNDSETVSSENAYRNLHVHIVTVVLVLYGTRSAAGMMRSCHFLTYRPIGDHVDPRGKVGVGDVTRQVVHKVNDHGADLRRSISGRNLGGGKTLTKLRFRTCLDCKG